MKERLVMPIKIVSMPFVFKVQLLQVTTTVNLLTYIHVKQKARTQTKYLTGEQVREAPMGIVMEYYAAIKGNSKEVAAEKNDSPMY